MRHSRIGKIDCQRWSFSKLRVALTISSESPASTYTWLEARERGPGDRAVPEVVGGALVVEMLGGEVLRPGPPSRFELAV